jgi:hypothetical protein
MILLLALLLTPLALLLFLHKVKRSEYQYLGVMVWLAIMAVCVFLMFQIK